VQGTSDAITNLQNGNFGAAAVGSLRTFNNAKNTNIKTVAGAELQQTAINILRGQNTQSTVFVPTAASVTDGIAKAVQSIPGIVNPGKQPGGIPNINSQSNKVPSPDIGTIFS